MKVMDLMKYRFGGGAARVGRLCAGALLLALPLLTSACELTVTNPGKIASRDLEDPRLVEAVVIGAVSDLGYAALVPGLGGVFVMSSLLSDELVMSGTRQGPKSLSDGMVRDDYSEAQSWWGYLARSRWTTEDAVARAERLVENPDADPNVALASLFAGFANRIGGDNFCHTVIDMGPLEPTSVSFERALAYFTKAIEVGTAAGIDSIVTAAYGGRAQAYMMLGKWDSAVEDARKVPTDFRLSIHNSSAGRNLNYYWSYTRGSVKNYTSWGTPYVEWGVDYNGNRNIGDPRVIIEPSRQADGSFNLGPDNRRPIIMQRKYTSTVSAVPLIKGTEMRLIAAEAELVRGNWQAAIDSINALRTALNVSPPSAWGANRLQPVAATSLDEAWEVLMRERGLELWLEGRRLADYRRWAEVPGKEKVPFTRVRQAANSPDPEDDPRVSVYQVNNELCLPISLTEKLANPNIGGGE